MPQDGLGGRPGQWACAIQLFLPFWLLSFLVFFESASLPRTEYPGSAGVTCATAVLSIQPETRKTYLRPSRQALFLDMGRVWSSREEMMESRLFSIVLPCASSFLCTWKQLYKDDLGTGQWDEMLRPLSYEI